MTCVGRSVLVAALLAGVGGAVAAAEAVFELRPLAAFDDGVYATLQAVSEPPVGRGDDTVGSYRDGHWALTVPLASYRTDLRLQIAGADPHAYPIRPLSMALPYRDQKSIRIVIPFLNEPDSRFVRGVYGGHVLLPEASDQLAAYLHASRQIDWLRQESNGAPSEELTRALIVWAEALRELVDKTDWFATPREFEERRVLAQQIELRAAESGRFRNRINLGRLRRAMAGANDAEAVLYKRAYDAINEMDSDRECNEIFPVALPFYETLKQMPPNDYRDIRSAAKFSRSEVLNQTTGCFRQLLTREDGTLSAKSFVEERFFGRRTAPEMATYLRTNLTEERNEILREEGITATQGSACAPEGVQPGPTLTLVCESLDWLAEAKPLMVMGEQDG